MATGSSARLSVRGVSKNFGTAREPHLAVSKFDLDVFEGEFLSMFGPNGCGKTTLINMIAGITDPDEGAIEFISRRNLNSAVGIVFQNYEQSLMPWRTCLDNVALPLEAQSNMSRRERREKANSVLQELGLNLPLDHYPYQMSGGQKQLTCIGRAMVNQPSLLLLDEPFASLDYQTRMEMQIKLQDIWQKTQVTTIFVSHEVDEAIYLADRLLLLTSRPARIAAAFDVPLSRPRGLDVFSDPSFVNLKTEILKRFKNEVQP